MKFVRLAAVIFSMTKLMSSLATSQEGNNITSHTPGYADMQTCPQIQPEPATRNHRKTMSFAFLVGVNGEVMQSKLTKSSGDKDLDQKTLRALQECTFHPATFHGQSQISWVMLSYKLEIL